MSEEDMELEAVQQDTRVVSSRRHSTSKTITTSNLTENDYPDLGLEPELEPGLELELELKPDQTSTLCLNDQQLQRKHSSARSLNRLWASRSRQTSSHHLISPQEVLTIGIGEGELLQIALETLGLKKEDFIKFFETENWFNSSGDSKTVPSTSSPGITGTKTGGQTPGFSILQQPPIRNPFFHEDNITGAPLTGVSLSDTVLGKLLTDDRGSLFTEDKEQQEKLEGTVIKKQPKHRHSRVIVVYTLLTITAICLGLLLAGCLTLAQGTSKTSKKYLESLSPEERASFIDVYSSKNSSAVRRDQLSHFYNSFDRINPVYQTNNNIQKIMNNIELKNVFYGINYAPKDANPGNCGVKLEDVLLDIATLSMVTTRLKLYSLGCDQLLFTLEAIQELGVNMTVSLGLWLSGDQANNENQFKLFELLLNMYPTNLIDSVVVGNEALLREELNITQLEQYVQRLKKLVNSKNDTLIQIEVSEDLKSFHRISEADSYGLNIHPFFEGEHVSRAVPYISKVFQRPQTKRRVYVSEIGWPSEGGQFRYSFASKENLQILVNEFVCYLNREQIRYYWFELFDEPWKHIYDHQDRKWESKWGLFDLDRNLKITLPDCL